MATDSGSTRESLGATVDESVAPFSRVSPVHPPKLRDDMHMGGCFAPNDRRIHRLQELNLADEAVRAPKAQSRSVAK